MAESIEIREERQDDVAAIRDVNRLAFGQSQEGEIVDALRANGGVLLSLVAVSNGKIVGHVLYSPIVVGSAFQGAALGPMAVLPAYRYSTGRRPKACPGSRNTGPNSPRCEPAILVPHHRETPEAVAAAILTRGWLFQRHTRQRA